MPVRIDALTICRPRASESAGSRSLALGAAQRCLRAAACSAGLVELVVYAGIFRDAFVMEPAQAPYLTRALIGTGAPGISKDRAFSFEVDDAVVALELAAGAVEERAAKRALVVAVDGFVDRSRGGGLAVAPAAAAVLLGLAQGSGGLVRFHARTFPEHRALYESWLRWCGDDPAADAPHAIVITQAPGYLEASVDAARIVVTELLDASGLAPADVLIAPSQSPPGLPGRLAAALSLPAARVVALPPDAAGRLLTAGPLLALDAATVDGRLEQCRHAVIVSVSPGITARAALYRPV
ncbi:MAG: hypothetical protein ACYS22_05205 [Planctomycetota bacterium]|jgi:3-oxoacyl-[acyl-carrier-protein] synthase III